MNTAQWRITGGRRLTPAPFIVAGIVNLTPDSFSDGGQYIAEAAAMSRVRAVLDEGAHIVDLGPESTRPGAQDIGHDEEWRRLKPLLGQCLALRATNPENPSFCLSIDTFRAATAEAALGLHAGLGQGVAPVDIINDISGGLFDPAMDAVLAAHKPGYVLCHCPSRPFIMQREPCYDNVVDEVLNFFENRMASLVRAGLPEECIALDPGIGFGKNLEHCLSIFRALPRFAALGRPLYLGISRKSFIGALTGLPLEKRGPATAVAVALLAERGVQIHRVHDVEQAVAALTLARAFSKPIPQL